MAGDDQRQLRAVPALAVVPHLHLVHVRFVPAASVVWVFSILLEAPTYLCHMDAEGLSSKTDLLQDL